MQFDDTHVYMQQTGEEINPSYAIGTTRYRDLVKDLGRRSGRQSVSIGRWSQTLVATTHEYTSLGAECFVTHTRSYIRSNTDHLQ